jgi:hypothetical protein
MAHLATRHKVLGLLVSLALAAVAGSGIIDLRGSPGPAQAQQSPAGGADRAAAVAGYFAAEGSGDATAAAATFASSAISAGANAAATATSADSCFRATPCTDPATIRAQIDHNIAIHSCHTIVELTVAGAVVTGRMENRNDNIRANGIEHTIQGFLALVPQDKITYLTVVPDFAYPPTALNQAIGAGTGQPVNPPIPTPATPCAEVSGA